VPAVVRFDEQHCPIARALDAIGDRWTLLILRELNIADQRFTDLAEQLPGIAPALLRKRLRTLIDDGLIATTPEGAKRPLYTATRRGRDAVTVLRALTRFGMPLLEEPAEDAIVRPWTAVHAGLSAFYRPLEAVGIDERYRLVVDGEEFTLSSVPGGGAPRQPDLELVADARTMLDVRQGRRTLRGAIEAGLVSCTGSDAALGHFERIFALTSERDR